MAAREDALGHADLANQETFGDGAALGWDAEDMLTAHAADVGPPPVEYCAGTCGFMGVAPRKYAGRYPVVELNFTFHDRGDGTYERQAANYARLGLRVVAKVSGYATHEAGLADPSSWWPWLRSKYAALVNARVLLGLLWQLPPSFVRTEEALGRLDALGALLRSPGQTQGWAALHHAFEFRDSSWYGSPEVAGVLERHSLALVHLHVHNDTGWAGDLASGWHSPEGAGRADFTYVRCFGSSGRSIGKYSEAELHHIADVMRNARTAVAMFGQGDVPSHALENASELQEMITGERASAPGPAAADASPTRSGDIVSGRIVSFGRGYDRKVIVDVDGRRGYLGSRHIRKRGLQLKRGSVLDNLRVEGEQGTWLVLSVCPANDSGAVSE